jgi:hypothetical protein
VEQEGCMLDFKYIGFNIESNILDLILNQICFSFYIISGHLRLLISNMY